MHHLLFTFTVAFILSSLPGFAGNEYTTDLLNPATLSELIQSKDQSIRNLGDRGEVYVWPEAILPTEKGLFLRTEKGHMLLLPFLVSSEQGCYTVLSEENSTVYPIIKCKGCGKPFSPTFFNGGKCPSCGTQN